MLRPFVTCLGLMITALLLASCQPSNKAPLERWQHAVDGAYAADIADNAKISAVSSIHHGISLWDLEKNALLFSWSQQQESSDNLVLAIDIASNNSHVLAASRHNFSLWNAQTGQSEGYWQMSQSSIRDIAVSNNGKHVLIDEATAKLTISR